MKARTACLTALVIASGGAPESAAQEPPRWQLSAEPSLEIGVVEGRPAYQLYGAISSVRLDDGRIVVLNAGSHELRIYDADGRILGAVGREGEGPGEFRSPVRLYRLGRDSVMVYDRGNARFSVHTVDGTFVRTEPAPLGPGRFPYDEWLYDRSWIDGPPLGRGRGPVRAAVDGLPEPDREIGYRYVKVSPQGHLWVRRPGPQDSPVTWTIYDLDARAVGRITTPARFDIHEIGRDYLLGTGRDALDVEYIRLYRLTGAEDVPVRTIADADPSREGGADAAGSERASRSAARQRVLGAMRGTVRMLATHQEIFYSSGNRSYTTDLDQLEDWAPPEELLVRVARASPRGWTALIIEPESGLMCGMSYGAHVPVGWPAGRVICQ